MEPSKQEAWKAIGEIAKTKWSPRKGIKVNITRGKHIGKSGVVFWHGADQFSNFHKYDATAMQGAIREIIGKYGYSIGVETDAGEKFFTKAEYAANPDCEKCKGAGFTNTENGSVICYC